MPRIEVDISQSQMEDIKAKVKEDLEYNFNHEKLMAFLKETQSISIQDYIWRYGLGDRVEKLKDKAVKDLSSHDRLLLTLYWSLTGRLSDR